jgi:hypothetical protein
MILLSGMNRTTITRRIIYSLGLLVAASSLSSLVAWGHDLFSPLWYDPFLAILMLLFSPTFLAMGRATRE